MKCVQVLSYIAGTHLFVLSQVGEYLSEPVTLYAGDNRPIDKLNDKWGQAATCVCGWSWQIDFSAAAAVF